MVFFTAKIAGIHDDYTGCWFQTFFIFHIWDNPSHWLIFFKTVKTTNQYNHIYIYIYGGSYPKNLVLYSYEKFGSIFIWIGGVGSHNCTKNQALSRAYCHGDVWCCKKCQVVFSAMFILYVLWFHLRFLNHILISSWDSALPHTKWPAGHLGSPYNSRAICYVALS